MEAEFPEVTYERSARRLIPHEARNRGVELARGELLVFTDPDCVPHPDWIRRLVRVHDAGHPIVAGAIEDAGSKWFDRGVHLTNSRPGSPERSGTARRPCDREPPVEPIGMGALGRFRPTAGAATPSCAGVPASAGSSCDSSPPPWSTTSTRWTSEGSFAVARAERTSAG